LEALTIPFCRICGLAVNETDKFCGRCGNPLEGEVMYANGIWPVKFYGKRSTNFSNGFLIGASAVLVVTGLIWWSWLNSNFWQTKERLIASGLTLKDVNFLLLDNAFLISFCIFATIVGSYWLIFYTITQFSPTINSLMHKGVNRARWGSALIFGGILCIVDVVTFFVPSFYRQEGYPFSMPYFAIAGILLLIVGSFLMVNAYKRSISQQQKFKEQNRPLQSNSE
jgi:hypothetical protein